MAKKPDKVFGVIFGVLLLIFVVKVFVFPRLHMFYNLALGDITVGFISDIGKFSEANQRLPNSWPEFKLWMRKQGNERWEKEDLTGMFKLKWGTRVSSVTESDQLLTIYDSRLKEREQRYNVYLVSSLRVQQMHTKGKSEGSSPTVTMPMGRSEASPTPVAPHAP